MILGRRRKDAGLKPEEEEEEEEERRGLLAALPGLREEKLAVGAYPTASLLSFLPRTTVGWLGWEMGTGWVRRVGRPVVHRLTKVSSFPGGNAEEETLRRRHWM